jgi:hypothetical protein
MKEMGNIRGLFQGNENVLELRSMVLVVQLCTKARQGITTLKGKFLECEFYFHKINYYFHKINFISIKLIFHKINFKNSRKL